MSGAVVTHGVCAGATSRDFGLCELRRALQDAGSSGAVLVSVNADGTGVLAARAGPAAVTVAARLAPHAAAATMELQLVAPAAGEWRLRLVAARALAPHADVVLWPEPALLALCGVPYLCPRNMVASAAEYRCHECGERFADPNPLKLHLLLRCGAPSASAFWRELLRRLEALPTPAPSHRTTTPPASAPLYVTLLRVAGDVSSGGRGGGGVGHACPYCGRLYSRRYGLKIHIRTHTGYKPLMCAHCPRRFGDPSNLNKHVRLHNANAHK